MPKKTKTVKRLDFAALAARTSGYRARVKSPITLKLSEDVLHALARCQAELRCTPGVRAGDATVGAIVDVLLRQELS